MNELKKEVTELEQDVKDLISHLQNVKNQTETHASLANFLNVAIIALNRPDIEMFSLNTVARGNDMHKYRQVISEQDTMLYIKFLKVAHKYLIRLRDTEAGEVFK